MHSKGKNITVNLFVSHDGAHLNNDNAITTMAAVVVVVIAAMFYPDNQCYCKYCLLIDLFIFNSSFVIFAEVVVAIASLFCSERDGCDLINNNAQFFRFNYHIVIGTLFSVTSYSCGAFAGVGSISSTYI